MASFVSATLVGTVASTSFSVAHTASAGGLEVLICVAERGTTGTSPSALTYGGVDVLTSGVAVTALCQTPSGQRAHRWYHLPRTLHPGAGSRTVAVTWAGVDNIAVAVIEVSATGTITIPSNNQSSTNATVAITAGTGDLTIGCAQANSATPAFAPASGQTEYLESVWFASSGHVVGVQTGVQTAASWTGAGSICASAFVIHEESGGGSSGAIERADETDTAFALAGYKWSPIGMSEEAETSFAFVGAKAGGVGQAGESGSAFAFSGTKSGAIELAEELAEAFALAGGYFAAIGLAEELDFAFTLAGSKHFLIGLSGETSSAYALGSGAVIEMAEESNAAFALVGTKHSPIGMAIDTSEAFAFSGSKAGTIERADELNAALALIGGYFAAIGLAEELDFAFAFEGAKFGFVGLAIELDSAFALEDADALPMFRHVRCVRFSAPAARATIQSPRVIVWLR